MTVSITFFLARIVLWLINLAGFDDGGATFLSPTMTSMQYDSVQNRTLLVDPDGGRATTVFDALNRIQAFTSPDNKVTTAQYDTDGRRTTLSMGLGSVRKYQYDAVGNLTTQIEYNAVGTPIITMIDSYDAVRNRTGRAKDGVVTTWIYDTGYRLLSQQTAGAHATFVYDNTGNGW